MNLIDLIIALTLAVFAVIGYRKGFLQQLILLAMLMVGIWAAVVLGDKTSQFLLSRWDLSPKAIPLLAFFTNFLLAAVAIHFLFKLISGSLTILSIAWLDHLLGLVLGMLKGALILSMLIAILQFTNVAKLPFMARPVEKSKLYEPVRAVAPTIYPYFRHFGNEALKQLHYEQHANTLGNDEKEREYALSAD